MPADRNLKVKLRIQILPHPEGRASKWWTIGAKLKPIIYFIALFLNYQPKNAVRSKYHF